MMMNMTMEVENIYLNKREHRFLFLQCPYSILNSFSFFFLLKYVDIQSYISVLVT